MHVQYIYITDLHHYEDSSADYIYTDSSVYYKKLYTIKSCTVGMYTYYETMSKNNTNKEDQ